MKKYILIFTVLVSICFAGIVSAQDNVEHPGVGPTSPLQRPGPFASPLPWPIEVNSSNLPTRVFVPQIQQNLLLPPGTRFGTVDVRCFSGEDIYVNIENQYNDNNIIISVRNPYFETFLVDEQFLYARMELFKIYEVSPGQQASRVTWSSNTSLRSFRAGCIYDRLWSLSNMNNWFTNFMPMMENAE